MIDLQSNTMRNGTIIEKILNIIIFIIYGSEFLKLATISFSKRVVQPNS